MEDDDAKKPRGYLIVGRSDARPALDDEQRREIDALRARLQVLGAPMCPRPPE